LRNSLQNELNVVEQKAKEIHKRRNELNQVLPESLDNALIDSANWKELSYGRSLFHQKTETATWVLPNRKFISSD
jgi:hypothetical protein